MFVSSLIVIAKIGELNFYQREDNIIAQKLNKLVNVKTMLREKRKLQKYVRSLMPFISF